MYKLLSMLLFLGNLFGDAIIYNNYPPKLFWKQKPKIKVLDNVEYMGITDNHLISRKSWGLLGNRLYQIPCDDVIEVKDRLGDSIQYNCNENTYEVPSDYQVFRKNNQNNKLFNVSTNLSEFEVLMDGNWFKPISIADREIFFYDVRTGNVSKVLCENKELVNIKNVYQIDCTENKNLMDFDEFLKLVKRRRSNLNVEALNVLLYGSLYLSSKPLRSSGEGSMVIGALMTEGIILGYSAFRFIIIPMFDSINIHSYKKMSKENKIRALNVWYANSGDELLLAYLLNMEDQ